MPTKHLPSNPKLDHLKYQAKDLLKAHLAGDCAAAQRLREFHPLFTRATDAEIFGIALKLSDAQLAIAREYGFLSWTRLKRHIDRPTLVDNLDLLPHERIEDATFRRAVDFLDRGDAADLRALLEGHPSLVHQRVLLEGGNYFRNPTLLNFAAENPVRHGTLPANIVQVASVILEAGAKRDISALNETLGLVCSGRVPRECGVQIPLIDLLCDHEADPNSALAPALGHDEFEAVNALLRRGARLNLPVASALGMDEDARQLHAAANAEDRHRALALAAQFGRTGVVQLLLDAGEDPNRYNPIGCHSHSTPLHQAAFAGHDDVIKLLVERGARFDIRDTLWNGTPAEWARYGDRAAAAEYLLRQEEKLDNQQ